MPESRTKAKVRPRCFIAMAFGHDDTDAIYETIAATLRALQITPIRVDRIEHNDNIDRRIISEIDKADFVIADLTYSRPSVYFEAGYGERKATVVYTVRRDHLKQKDDDPNGN